ncbi:MAG TPA: acetyl-CoA carboxylase biotin carboxyl carrier protein subunit [Bacteroidales bacterium]|nr:acetyl-CoA carboxylase biotin carboxyl carrier protein subunit [Bacteroidales bacterium]
MENESSVTRYKTLEIDSVRYRTTFNKKFDQRKPYEPINPDHILAFIPGTILKIYVKKGMKVKEGERLLVLEAMKMKNDLIAHRSGTIKDVLVAEGERVPKKQLLIELE